MVSYYFRIESPATEAEVIVGLRMHSLMHHHDLLEAVITCYQENVKTLEDVYKANDPFVNEENELINIITEAVMLVTVKEIFFKGDEIGQDLFNNFVKERIVECKLSVWSPMKKANPHSWKSTRAKKKSETASGVDALKDNRALFARFLIVALSRPEGEHQENRVGCIFQSTFQF